MDNRAELGTKDEVITEPRWAGWQEALSVLVAVSAQDPGCRVTFTGTKMNGSPISVTVGRKGKKFHFLEPLHVGVD